ncbi:IDEAL domain-containing protein [Bacillus sp. TH008]|uniref:IDEAL domain-containing protein n=1 Tax=Bacillus sp. TH008 TaxID=1609979 RepID=UPI0006173B7D|nr:IDEAL domain-containing protein [Bacillus sp. TH008]KKB72464.1 hypothetical protein TH62_16660 [Bacillus sp. TH008]
MTRLNVGDWVKFSPSNFYRRNQKLFIKGYIDDINGNHADIIGDDGKTYIGEKLDNLIPCEDKPEYTQADVRALMDVALDVKDRQWFEELTSELKRIQEVEG